MRSARRKGPRCEGCKATATAMDTEGVPLCDDCMAECAWDAKCDLVVTGLRSIQRRVHDDALRGEMERFTKRIETVRQRRGIERRATPVFKQGKWSL